jgi:hypothetical protein
MSAFVESSMATAPSKPLIARVNWVKAAPWLYTLALFAMWELLVYALKMPPTILPSPVRVGQAIVHYWSPIWKNSLQTLYTTPLGFAIAVAAGLAIGLFIGWSKTIYAGLYPLMIGFNAIPKVALVPILVIWFGIGTVPAVLTAPDFLLPHRRQRRDRSGHHRAGNGGRAARTWRQEDGYHAEGRHSALHALLLRLAENRHHARLRRLGRIGNRRLQLWPR